MLDFTGNVFDLVLGLKIVENVFFFVEDGIVGPQVVLFQELGLDHSREVQEGIAHAQDKMFRHFDVVLKKSSPTKNEEKSYFERDTRVPPEFPLQQMRKSERKATEFIKPMCMENTCSNNNNIDNNAPVFNWLETSMTKLWLESKL